MLDSLIWLQSADKYLLVCNGIHPKPLLQFGPYYDIKYKEMASLLFVSTGDRDYYFYFFRGY